MERLPAFDLSPERLPSDFLMLERDDDVARRRRSGANDRLGSSAKLAANTLTSFALLLLGRR